MKTRTSKTLGMAAAVAALAVSLPVAITAQAEPTPTTTTVKPPAEPQGNCDPLRKELATAGTTPADLAPLPVGQVLAKIPSLSTFYSAISGGLNPAVNVVPVLENGPYVIFAPNNDAFAKLDPAQLESLKSDPAALTKLDYYHVFLGLLNPGDVAGQRPTQQGEEIKVTGKDGDIKVNDTAKVICGGISAANARVYIIDTVLDPAAPPEALTPQTSFSNTGKPLTPTSTTSSSPSPAPTA
ncbi:fasciclin domain-containing protein [Mycolicibacterium grossiae]|uniref:Fasciclin n=1 Tax=Mycolicibacterium grossiae TaxID=1552759 RepID=A0A1E8Q0D9_9MYCO|nr:fasciclin domain-containing protein [Mycolicibacterium grossiae]OFJ51972.1 fasciclin [Mycolicibacterium grossiae]QEM47792.1 fasciclin domain-containing protein [Mycolicibacterium grossiae]